MWQIWLAKKEDNFLDVLNPISHSMELTLKKFHFVAIEYYALPKDAQ